MIRKTLHIKSFNFEAGGHLNDAEVVFHVSKENYSPGDKVIWVCHALTANSDVEDWWPQLVGNGKLLDTKRYFVVCVNMLCSPYGSSGPASTNPATGRPYFFDFPPTTVRDIITATIAVRKHLGIECVDLLVGSSIGGFQAIEWAVTEPDVFKNVAFIATAPRISPWLTALVETQRMALEADVTFRGGKTIKGGAAGLKCARAQALISYRCYDGFMKTQAEENPDTLFANRAASYERYQGEKLVRRDFDAYSYWYLCNVLDSHNVGRCRGGVSKALGNIRANVTVVAVDTDIIFPCDEIQKWSRDISNAQFVVVKSLFGHDGFLIEVEQLTMIFKKILWKL